ncbi:YgfZ/GcvT domain-containing protein [Haloferula chungangensis]|uniref:YgfZ/GcvT domain-containing protein n=1 Tax=Haloferula chungangensis TaxID=1048331 RepID=A0ABW2L330_9BACT
MSDSLNLPAQRPCILSFSGPDAVRFLNGQITQDVSRMSSQALTACVTDAKGRLQYFIKVFAGPDDSSIWVSCPMDESEGLRERLERYLIADDVEIEDLSGQWVTQHASRPMTSSTFVRDSKGCFGDGFDCWWDATTAPEIDSLDENQAERLRISQRIPRWGHELTAGILPPEAGLDKTSISYHKGCYIGQEVLSRLKSAGKLNRRLAAFEIEGNAAPGASLTLESGEVGQLTSCAPPNPADSRIGALGYLKKKGFDQREFQVTDSSGHVTGLATFSGWV